VAGWLLLTVTALGSFGFARYETWKTGTLEAIIDGQEYRSHTLATAIPEDVANDVADENQRLMLERIAGTTQHTAFWTAQAPLVITDLELRPARLRVVVTTRTDHPDGSGVNTFVLTFMLDPETLELIDEYEVEVNFYPYGPSKENFWRLADGTFTISEAAPAGPAALRLEGSFSGVLTRNSLPGDDEEPPEVRAVTATFTIEHVGSNDPEVTELPGF